MRIKKIVCTILSLVCMFFLGIGILLQNPVQAKETKAETGVHSALKLAYYEAYHDARKALNTGTNVEITNENVVVQSNFDMKA